MAKKRIGDIATAHDLNPKEVVKQLQEAGFSVQSPTSTIEESLAMKVLRVGGNGAEAEAPKSQRPPVQRQVQPAGSQPRAQRPAPPPSKGGRGAGAGGGGARSPQGQGGQRAAQGQRNRPAGGQRSGGAAPRGGGDGQRRPPQSGS